MINKTILVKNTFMSGKNFNTLIKSPLFIFNDENKIGLMIDEHNFVLNDNMINNGLIFTDINTVSNYYGHGVYLCDIEIPDDAIVYIDKYGYRTNKLIVKSVDDNIMYDTSLMTEIKVISISINNILKQFIIYRNKLLKNYDNQNKEFCMQALKFNPLLIKYVKNRSFFIDEEFIKKSPFSIKYVENQTNDMCINAVSSDGLSLKFVNFPNDNIINLAITQNPYALKYVDEKHQTENLCINAVKNNGLSLAYVINQTSEICLYAVRQNGWALLFVKNKTSMIQLEAVKQNAEVLQIIQDQNYELCYNAINQNCYALRYIRNPSFYIYLHAIKSIFYKWFNL